MGDEAGHVELGGRSVSGNGIAWLPKGSTERWR